MKILIGCDVDPVLPTILSEVPEGDVWACLDRIPLLVEELGSEMPPITWLVRADASVHFCTSDYASGYNDHRSMWDGLLSRGHELGWHMHLMTFDEAQGRFAFDADSPWLEEAHAALSEQLTIRSTRTGWDYADRELMGRLAQLGIRIDFSALPGAHSWIRSIGDVIQVDWLVTPRGPYRPSSKDYRRHGLSPISLIEVPITQFRASLSELAKRAAWRPLHGMPSALGLGNRTRLLTAHWPAPPEPTHDCMAFYFHPEELDDRGIANVRENLLRLRNVEGAEFVTASELCVWLENRVPLHGPMLGRIAS